MVKILEQLENQKAAMMEFRMKNGNHCARLLAHVTGLINQELLLQNEYLDAENRILRALYVVKTGNMHAINVGLTEVNRSSKLDECKRELSFGYVQVSLRLRRNTRIPTRKERMNSSTNSPL